MVRYLRLLALLGVVGAAALVVALAVGRPSAAHQPIRAAASPAGPTKPTLRHELQQFLATHPQATQSRPRIAPATGSQTCFVGAGSCSLHPCVVPVESTGRPAVSMAEAVATADSPVPASPSGAPVDTVTVGPAVPASTPVGTPAPPARVATVTVGPAVRSFTAPASRCHRGASSPHVLRVSGP